MPRGALKGRGTDLNKFLHLLSDLYRQLRARDTLRFLVPSNGSHLERTLNNPRIFETQRSLVLPIHRTLATVNMKSEEG